MKIALIAFILLLFTLGPAQSQPIPFSTLPPCDFAAESDIEGLEVGALIINMTTGEGCGENIDETFAVASVPKIFVAGAFLEAVAQGRFSFETEITFTYNYLMGGTNTCLTPGDVNTSMTLGYLSDMMIACSDNSATWILMDLLGRDAVQAYINRLGIPGIGPVIPYSEVDWLKLQFLDARWQDVPIDVASRFYRTRNPHELVPQYFSEAPRYSREELIQANAAYFATYNYNTATPRAIAQYFLKLQNDLGNRTSQQGQVAWWLLNTMLLTQRLYSTQAIPGTVFVGAKNGFDWGLVAEVSTFYTNLESRRPQAIAILFTQQDLEADTEIQPPSGRDNGPLNRYLHQLSPRISRMLYPDFVTPPMVESPDLSPVMLSPYQMIEDCWNRYEALGDNDFWAFSQLQTCWNSLPVIDQIALGDPFGIAFIMYNLNGADTRLTFLTIAPNGAQYAYQRDVQLQQNAAVFWQRNLDMEGTWRIEVYRNLQKIYVWYVTVTPAEN